MGAGLHRRTGSGRKRVRRCEMNRDNIKRRIASDPDIPTEAGGIKNPRRALATFNRRESCAELSTPDRETTAFVKLRADGVLVISVYRNGKDYRRELTP